MKIRAAAPLGLTLLLLASVAAAAPFDLPDDARALLPGEPAAIMATASLNAMLDEFVAIARTFAPEDEVSREEILADLGGELGPLLDIVDMDRPLVVAAGVPNPMSGTGPPVTMIVPVRPDAGDLAESLPPEAPFADIVRKGDYAAVSMDPAYAPGTGGTSALAAHLPAGIVGMTVDLDVVMVTYRPLIEMGLASIPTRPDGTPADSTGAMTAAEAAALAQSLRNVLDSAARLDLAVGRRGELLTWFTGLGVKPGSALDPGPQPDFARALALTAALPESADLWQVLAQDQTRMFEAFRDFYIVSIANSLGAMEAAQREDYQAWVEQYLASMDLWANPTAAALRTEGESMAAHVVMEVPDAADARDRLAAIITGLGALDIGYRLTPRDETEIGGVAFASWDIAFDMEKFEATMPQGGNPALTGTGRMQAEQLVSILRKIMPRLYLGAADGHLFLASDDDTEELAALVRNVDRGTPRAAVQEVADQAGPACRQVIRGDLMTILQWVTDLMAEIEGEEKAVLADNPIPFQAFVTVDGTDFGFEAGMDLQALSRVVAAMEALED